MEYEKKRTSAHHDVAHDEFLIHLNENLTRLNRFCRSIARDDAKEVMSETIYRALLGFDRLRDKQAFTSYLFTIATRVNRGREREQRRWTFFTRDAESIAAPESAIEMSDVEFLYKALARLPLRQREAVVLFEINGFSIEEIRKVQGGTLSGVKSRIARGRETLKRLLVPPDQVELNIATSSFLSGSGTPRPHSSQFAYSTKEKL